MHVRYARTIVGSALVAAMLSACAGSSGVPTASLSESRPESNLPQSTPAHYTVVELDSLGGTVSGAISINENGLASGFSVTGTGMQNAALWRGTAVTGLGTLGGPNSAVAWPNHSDRGAVVGISDTSNLDPLHEPFSCQFDTTYTCQGFVWRDGTMTPLPTLGGYNSYATDINNGNQIVGWAENTVHDPTCVSPQVLQFEAVIWGPHSGQMQQLSPLQGDSDTAATAINDLGQVVGISGACDVAFGGTSAAHAVLWQNGTVTDLGNFGGKAFNTAAAINNLGQVTGWSDFPGDAVFHAFVWSQATGIHDIGVLPGDTYTLAYAINNSGQVVGQSLDASFNSRAFIYQNGQMYDLNALVLSGSPYLIYANDINSNGEIVGAALDQHTGNVVAFRAIPQQDTAQSALRIVQTVAKVTLPQNLRVQLRRRGIFGRMDRVGPTH